jgi:hypothetical protein
LETLKEETVRLKIWLNFYRKLEMFLIKQFDVPMSLKLKDFIYLLRMVLFQVKTTIES